MANSIYTVSFEIALAPAGIWISQFDIFSAGRMMKIKNINLQRILFNTTAGTVIPEAQNTDIFSDLRVGLIPVKIGKTFIRIAGAAFNDTGSYFRISKVGENHFDSFFISERLPFEMVYENRGLNDIAVNVSLLVEVEENIKYD